MMDMTSLPHIPTTRKELLETGKRIAKERNPNFLEVLGLVQAVTMPHIEKKHRTKLTGFAWNLENKQYQFLASALNGEALAGRDRVIEMANHADFDESSAEQTQELLHDCAMASFMNALARACEALASMEPETCN